MPFEDPGITPTWDFGVVEYSFAPCILALHRLGLDGNSSIAEDALAGDPPLRPCQKQCLEACAKGARVIEMACGTGKTRVIKEIVKNISGRVP